MDKKYICCMVSNRILAWSKLELHYMGIILCNIIIDRKSIINQIFRKNKNIKIYLYTNINNYKLYNI